MQNTHSEFYQKTDLTFLLKEMSIRILFVMMFITLCIDITCILYEFQLHFVVVWVLHLIPNNLVYQKHLQAKFFEAKWLDYFCKLDTSLTPHYMSIKVQLPSECYHHNFVITTISRKINEAQHISYDVLFNVIFVLLLLSRIKFYQYLELYCSGS